MSTEYLASCGFHPFKHISHRLSTVRAYVWDENGNGVKTVSTWDKRVERREQLEARGFEIREWKRSKSDSFARSILKYSTKYSQPDYFISPGVFGGTFYKNFVQNKQFGRLPVDMGTNGLEGVRTEINE